MNALTKTASRLHRLTGDIDRTFMLIAVVAGLLFAVLSLLVASHKAPFFFDRPVSVAVQSINLSAVDPFNRFVSAFSGLVGVGVGAAVIVAAFLLRRPATPFVAFTALYSVIYNVVNIVIRRPRPTGLAHTTRDLMGYSYPSGHVGFFLWLGVLAMVLLVRGLPTAIYRACWVGVAVLVAASAWSRVYVGAHWASDVIGGLLVGIFWTCLSLSLGRLTAPVFGPRSVR